VSKKPNKPDWHKAAVAAHGSQAAAGTVTRAEAATAVEAVIRSHPAYVADLIAADAKHDLNQWLNGNGSSGDLLQASLFPELPVRMRVSPNRTVEVSKMTRADLEHARNILLARTQNAINGAKSAADRDRAVFAAFYDRVRPLLADGRTVADVLADLAATAA
jgi:hypothetical protein